jgi:hypothetical protein
VDGVVVVREWDQIGVLRSRFQAEEVVAFEWCQGSN